MNILHINTNACGGSIPSHIEMLARRAFSSGHAVAVARGRGAEMKGVRNIAIGNQAGLYAHVGASRLFDAQGLAGRNLTRRFIREAEEFAPDIVHLHNLHGYYLHYPTLFQWLKDLGRPVVWTLHDCWPFTGHCASISDKDFECDLWRTGCEHCPRKKTYPSSYFSRSERNFLIKRQIFNSLPNLTLISPSEWLTSRIADSFLGNHRVLTIPHDVDIEIFRRQPVSRKKRILGVASKWSSLKGLGFFEKLSARLPADYEIRLIGDGLKGIDKRIVTLPRIDDPRSLAQEYSQALLYLNPSYAESYSMTNREALACGTPVVTRNVGGAIEGIGFEETGLPVWSAEHDDELLKLVLSKIKEQENMNDWDAVSLGASDELKKRFSSQPGAAAVIQLYETLTKHKDV